jgi:putative transposase
MYSREKKMKAVELYIKYDLSASAVIHELGYPDRKTLIAWYKAYQEELIRGVEPQTYHRKSTI